MSDTLASILKQAEAHGILQRKVVKGGETEYLPTHPGEASTANKAAVTPPKPVQQAAALGLELRRQFGRGGTEVGVARARDLSNGRAVSEDTLVRMRSYFARHAVDAQADGWKDEANPSAGWIAWLLWGGDEGRDWVEGLLGEKYSPNQPRDESGRFGSGGGTGKINSFDNMGDAQSWGTSNFDGWRKSLNPDEVDALDMYAASKYTLVNGTLRGQIESTGPRGDLAKNLTAKMDSALDKDGLEEDVTVYRRMGRRFSDLDLQPGDIIQDNGFVSTSLLQEPLQEHFRGSVAKISVPKGIKAAYLGFADERMGVAKEQELVLQRGLKLRVKNYDPNGVSELEVLGV